MGKPVKTLIVLTAATTTAWLYHVINAITGLITLPLILACLGKSEYGIWVLIGQVTAILAMSDIGTANATSRFIAKFRGQNDHEAVSHFLSTVIFISIVLALCVAFLTLVLTPWIDRLLGIEKNYALKTKTVFIICGMSLAFFFPIRIGWGVLAGYQMYGPHGIGKILKSVLYLCFLLTLAYIGYLNVISLAIASNLSLLLAQIVLFFVAWRLTKPWNLSLKKISWKMTKQIFSFGSSSIVMTLSNMFYERGIGIAVGRVAGLGSVAIYGIASNVIKDIEPTVSAVGMAVPTLASEFHARGEIERLKKIINSMIFAAFSMTLSAVFGLYVYMEPLLKILLRKRNWNELDFQQISNVIMIMGIGLALGLPQMVSRTTLQSVGRHWNVTYAVLVSSVLSFIVGLTVILCGWGVYGAASAFALTYVIQGVFIFPRMICKFLDESLWQMIIHSYLPGLLVGLVVFCIAKMVSFILVPSGIINLICGIAISAVCGISLIIALSGQFKIFAKAFYRFF